MNEQDIDKMTPDERVLRVIQGVDEMLSVVAHQEGIENNTISYEQVDPYITDKISTSLRWLTGNIKMETIVQFIDNNEFEYPDVIKNLLQESYFNVSKYN